MKSKKLKGSFTVEAAVVVPIVMFIITGIIFILFFAHDAAVMDSLNSYAVVDNADKYKENSAKAAGELKDYLEKGLIITGNIKVDEEKRLDGIVVRSCGNFSIPTLALKGIFGASSETVSSEIKVSSLYGRTELLKYKALVKGLENSGKEES